MDRDAVTRWTDGYRRAWDSNDPDEIRVLFSADGEYRFDPWEGPVRGREAIVAAWLERADAPGDHRFDSAVIAVDGDLAIVQGRTEYDDGRRYENLWVIRLADDGTARSFTEWYMAPPRD